MAFLHRLGYYLGGFSVGLVLLFFIFNGKRTQCHYGPQARVLDNLGKKEWTSEVALPSTIQLDSLGIRQILQPATVDFSASETQRDSCKIYVIENEKGEFRLQNCSKLVTIQAFTPLP